MEQENQRPKSAGYPPSVGRLYRGNKQESLGGLLGDFQSYPITTLHIDITPAQPIMVQLKTDNPSFVLHGIKDVRFEEVPSPFAIPATH